MDIEVIPNDILLELERTKKDFPDCWIGHCANDDKYHVYIIPDHWTNSLMIRKVYQNG